MKSFFSFKIQSQRPFLFALDSWIPRLALLSSFALMSSLPSMATASFEAPASWNCKSTLKYGQSEKWICEHPISKKEFQIYSLRGTRLETARAQGYLTAEEFVNDTYQGLKTTIERSLSTGGVSEAFTRSIYQCYAQRVKLNLHPEMKSMAKAFSQGIAERRGHSSKHTDEALTMLASYEIANVITGFKQILSTSSLKGFAELTAVCGLSRPLFSLGELVESLGRMESLKLGCTGFALPSRLSSEKSMIHGRNLDGGFVEFFNENPSLYFVEEEGKIPFIAAAPAGSLISGSVSGMNSQGISVSLHQLSTTSYQSSHSSGSGSSAPYLQHLVLSEASSIQEAYEIVRRSKRFGAWTMLVSDAKTQEAASIEFTGDKVQLARHSQNQLMAQSNHYLGSKMQDQYFTYSLAKQIESETRLDTVHRFFSSKDKFSLQDSIELLVGHSDPWSPLISVGRTTTKTYTLMTTLALPESKQFWFTIGDSRPGNHSHFVGFEVDWNASSFKLLESRRAENFRHKKSWVKSVETFVDAYVATLTHNYDRTLNQLDEAFLLARRDGVFEKNYLFMKARVLEDLGRTSETVGLWSELLEDVERTPNETSYALRVRMHWLNAMNGSQQRIQQLERFNRVYSNALFQWEELRKKYPHHLEIEEKREQLDQIWKGRPIKWNAPEFITIE